MPEATILSKDLAAIDGVTAVWLKKLKDAGAVCRADMKLKNAVGTENATNAVEK